MRRLIGLRDPLPLSETARRREVERTMAGVRCGALVLYAVSAAVRPGDDLFVTWLVFAVLAATTFAGVGASRLSSRPARWGAQLTALDCAVLLALLANNTSDPLDVVYITALLPTIEGALRWAKTGGIGIGLLMAGAVGAWTVHITETAGETVTLEQPVLRGGAMAVIGWGIGSIVAHLRGQQVALQLALDSARDPMLTIGDQGSILSANEASEVMFGRPVADLVGSPFFDLLAAGDRIADEPVGPADVSRTTELALTTPDGTQRWIEVELIPIADLGISYARCRDVTIRLEATRRLDHAAHHDPLTDLANRRLLLDALDGAIRGAPCTTTLVFIDLDGFKAINDELGHDAGDEVLCLAAERMRRCVRSSDLVARFAGDEFCIMLPDTESPIVDAITERVCEALHEPFSVAGRLIQIAASLGTVRHQPDETAVALLRRADRAMYEAKSAGGNRVHPPGLRSVS